MLAVVLGFGLSGQAACALLRKKGFEVWVIDDKPKVGARQDAPVWSQVAFCVLSPGMPLTHRYVLAAQGAGVEILSEIECALRFAWRGQKLLGITGTNGKTTVTLLTEHVLRAAGFEARAMGNVGEPLCSELPALGMQGVGVVELSSYQLETLYTRAFSSSCLLNITPDHLDRYGTMRNYAKAKFLIQKVTAGKTFVQEACLKDYADLAGPSCHSLSGQWRLEGKDIASPTGRFTLPACCALELDCENALAVWYFVHELGVSPECFVEALTSFKKPHHRIEFVCEIDGVRYFDDSKGTNFDAVVRAVDSLSTQNNVIVIVGGKDKGLSYKDWQGSFSGKVKAVLAIGETAAQMCKELAAYKPENMQTLDRATSRAADLAGPGDVVLLSPGCSSFDQFRDYAHRGEEFQRLVHTLARTP